MRKQLFDRLTVGDNERDAILQNIIDNVNDYQIELAMFAAEQGHNDEGIFACLTDGGI